MMRTAVNARRLGHAVSVGVLLLSLLVTGCQGAGPKATLGGLGGAAGGGLIAAAAGGGGTAIAAGVIVGGLLGAAVGDRLDQRDRQIANQTAQRAFETAPSGQATTWRNPDSGNSGSVTPTRTYQAPNGRYCREFQQEVTIGGQRQQAYGTACRQPDGTWQIVS